MDFEAIINFLKDLWQALLDHWIITMFIIIFAFNVMSPPLLAAFAIFKLVDSSRKKHEDD